VPNDSAFRKRKSHWRRDDLYAGELRKRAQSLSAQTRANFGSGEIRILKSNSAAERVIVFDEGSKTVTRDAGLILA
jgi:hypothetical protein